MAGLDGFTKLLLHCNGVDGSTSFVDKSAGGHTVTAIGTAQVDTAVKKFGTGSVLFDGNSDYLIIPDSADWNFGSGDFTIDFWVYFNSLVNEGTAFEQRAGSGATFRMFNFFTQAFGGDKKLRFRAMNAGADIAVYDSSTVLAVDSWYHVALVRNGTNIYIFLNGIAETLTGNPSIGSTALPDISSAVSIGARAGGAVLQLDGYIDEFRISKGTARWTSNFTPPTSEYTSAADAHRRNQAIIIG